MSGSEAIAMWTARFADPELEAQFRREAMPKARRLALGFCLLGLVFYPLGGSAIRWCSPTGPSWN
ncbi:MAG: hypothetical protein NVV74_25785 [Magnetospirillum sp.]|nr:hypothetical protein [Magnetospirillum sp.]